jgi:hypothetical protein
MDESADIVLDNRLSIYYEMSRISDDSTEPIRFPQENHEIHGSALGMREDVRNLI